MSGTTTRHPSLRNSGIWKRHPAEMSGHPWIWCNVVSSVALIPDPLPAYQEHSGPPLLGRLGV
jgi:hypothetical protein